MPDLPNTTTLIGQKGSGKSSLARHLTSHCTRLLVIDTFHERAHDQTGLLFSHHLEAMHWMCTHRKFRIVYRPPDTAAPGVGRLFQHVLSEENLTCTIEEVSQYCSRRSWFTEGFEQFLRMGRQRAIKLLVTTHLPSDLHRFLFSESDLLLVGHTFEAAALRFLRDNFPAAAMERARDLPLAKLNGKKILVAFLNPRTDTVEEFSIDLPH